MITDPQLQKLLDKDEISDLLVSFGAALDAKDWQSYGNTFTEDGTFTIMGQKRTGRAEIVAGPERDLERYGILQHFSANHRIEVDGDEARASHYVIAVHGPDAATPSVHADVGGRYECRCVRTPEGWRFSEIVLTVLWSAGETFEIEPKDD
jgi:uncharacterized protein (TIGR02246 family)